MYRASNVMLTATTAVASGAVATFTYVRPTVTTLMQNKGVSNAVNGAMVLAIGAIGKKIAGYLGLYQDFNPVSDQLKNSFGEPFENTTNTTAIIEKVKELKENITRLQKDLASYQKTEEAIVNTYNTVQEKTKNLLDSDRKELQVSLQESGLKVLPAMDLGNPAATAIARTPAKSSHNPLISARVRLGLLSN